MGLHGDEVAGRAEPTVSLRTVLYGGVFVPAGACRFSRVKQEHPVTTDGVFPLRQTHARME